MSIIPQYKTCTKCGISKSITEFHKRCRSSDGYTGQCKHCRMNDAAREKADLASRGLRRCTKCNQIKPFSEFHEEGKGSFATRSDCKVCNRNRRQKYYHDDPELQRQKRREYHKENRFLENQKFHQWRLDNLTKQQERERKWAKNNPGKARAINQKRRARKAKIAGNYTAEEFRDLCEYYDNRCLCCSRNDVELTADHVIPLTWEGSSNDISNIQPLCLSCNSSKGNWRATDYRKLKEVY